MVWHGKNRKHPGTALACRHATAKATWAREEASGVRAHPVCGRTLAGPAGHHLALVGCWLGLGSSPGGVGPSFGMKVGFCLVPCCRICIMLSGFAPFA